MPYLFQSKRKGGSARNLRWRFQYTDWRGKRRSGTGTTSRAETEKLALRVQAEQDAIRRGWKPAPKSSDRARAFDEVVEEYLAWGESQGGRNGHPWAEVHARMRRSHLAWWKRRLNLSVLSDLTDALGRVEKALRDVEAAGRTGKTVQNYAEALAALCDWCVSREYLDGDPLRKLGAYNTTPRTKRRAMSGEEVAKLLETCEPRRRLTYEVAFATGLRAGELKSLRVRHLDRPGGQLRLEAAWTKNRRASSQPLPEWLAQRLAASIEGMSDDEPLLYVPSHAARDFDVDLKKAGIAKRNAEGKLDFHACRVAFISFVIEAGATVKEAQVLARHSTAEMTMNTYARTRSERLSEVAEIVGRRFRESTAGAQSSRDGPASDCGESTSVGWREGSIPAASTKSLTYQHSRRSRRRGCARIRTAAKIR